MVYIWRALLARRLPFYYGWVVFAVSAGASYSSRPLMSVAALSVFLVPMTDYFGWSRSFFSGAVSLGGLCAVAISPLVGRIIDRYGSGVVVGVTGGVVGLCAIGLSLITQTWAFYALYVPGRMAFASPLELGTSTAISNWFIRRRPTALALLSVTQGTGLAAMPLVVQFIIGGWGWRTAWASLGIYTLAVAVIPPILLIARRPEDMGLEADPGGNKDFNSNREAAAGGNASGDAGSGPEVSFTVRQALRTRAFWILAAFSAAGFMVQAGVSLHQAPHYLGQGLSGPAAALTASVFAFSQVPGGLLWPALTRWLPARALLALSGISVAVGAAGTAATSTLGPGLAAAAALGIGVGGLHLLLRLVWADYYGRRHLGSIRGLTLPAQIGGQALGPVIAGRWFDVQGGYQIPFTFFAIVVALASLLALAATPPGPRVEERVPGG